MIHAEYMILYFSSPPSLLSGQVLPLADQGRGDLSSGEGAGAGDLTRRDQGHGPVQWDS